MEKKIENFKDDRMKKIIALCKHRGILFQNSEIYGGLENTWDYGPLGVLMKNNLKANWWKYFVQTREDIFGLDSSILSLAKVWEASGHLDLFHDQLIDCKNCKQRFRVDELQKKSSELTNKKDGYIVSNERPETLHCPYCHSMNLTEKRDFHLMFKTYQGAIKDQSNAVYLRPETAQGIFVNFKKVRDSMRASLPFGIAQIGKAFRNEITPNHFIFRMREFEQMEIEYFIHPKLRKEYFEFWIKECKSWYMNLGLKEENLKIRSHLQTELAHYAIETVDIEYAFPFGWAELQGIACRGDFDLKKHQEYSSTRFESEDLKNNESYIPHVIEPSFGLDRSFLALLVDAYHEDRMANGEQRILLSLDLKVAPIKIAIFPLKRNHSIMVDKARKIASQLRKYFHVQYDDRGSIGKLYRRQDEIGTPFCVTVDFNSLLEENPKITIRERDSMKQISLELKNIVPYFKTQFDI